MKNMSLSILLIKTQDFSLSCLKNTNSSHEVIFITLTLYYTIVEIGVPYFPKALKALRVMASLRYPTAQVTWLTDTALI